MISNHPDPTPSQSVPIIIRFALRMEQESGGKSVIRHIVKNWVLRRGEKAAMAQSALRHEARYGVGRTLDSYTVNRAEKNDLPRSC